MKNFLQKFFQGTGKRSGNENKIICDVSYDTVCRQCLGSTGFRHHYQFIQPDSATDRFLEKSEFQMGVEMEQIRRKESLNCENCGSNNIEVQNIEVNGRKLYSFEQQVAEANKNKTQIFIINIQKKNEDFEVKMGGTTPIDTTFKGECLSLIRNVRNNLGYEFISQSKGNFNIVVSSKRSNAGILEVKRIERLINLGISEQEIQKAIESSMGQKKTVISFTSLPLSNFFNHNLSFTAVVKGDNISKEIHNFSKKQDCLTETVIFALSNLLATAMFLRKNGANVNVQQLGNIVQQLPISVGVPFKSVAESAKSVLMNFVEMDTFENVKFQISSSQNNCFTETIITSVSNQSSIHSSLSAILLVYDVYRMVEKVSWEGAATVGEFIATPRFPFYNKYIESLEHVGKFISSNSENLDEDKCAGLIVNINFYLQGARTKIE